MAARKLSQAQVAALRAQVERDRQRAEAYVVSIAGTTRCQYQQWVGIDRGHPSGWVLMCDARVQDGASTCTAGHAQQ